jgi:hypothetical protein
MSRCFFFYFSFRLCYYYTEIREKINVVFFFEPFSISQCSMTVLFMDVSMTPSVNQGDATGQLVPPTPIVPQTEGGEEVKKAPVVIPSDSDAVVKEADVWTNGEYAFRVDQVASAGGVHIRFRTDAHLDARPFSPGRILVFFKRKESVPEGEWFFGSVDEFERFVQEGGYQLEKRGKVES